MTNETLDALMAEYADRGMSSTEPTLEGPMALWVPALVAEVRRLRALTAQWDGTERLDNFMADPTTPEPR